MREIYRSLETPGANELRIAHTQLDEAVRAAYGMAKNADSLRFLFELNQELAGLEKDDQPLVGPGLPRFIVAAAPFLSADAISMPA